jgi:predicted transcriptional regulator of viral defense system
MIEAAPTAQSPRSTAALIWHRIEAGGERLWRMEDFRELPFQAVAQALSRLAKSGVIERLSKGVYYRARPTALGRSRPNPASLQKLVSPRQKVYPAGLAAANLLGFTTQSGPQLELATSGLSLPRKLVGNEAVIHTRRPEAWAGLTEIEAALLDFLRRGGQLPRRSGKIPHLRS